MEVCELGAERADWDVFVRTSPDGSPFHLTAWKELVEATFGHRSRYLLARRAGEIQGVLPLFELSCFPVGRALVSVPYATYGGICARSDDARRSLLDAARSLGRRLGVRYVELRHVRDQGLELPPSDLYVTFARPITGDDDANLQAIPGKQRRMIRQGARHGLRSEMDDRHADGFYGVYAESVRNLGSPVYPRALFRNLLQAFGKEAQVLTVWRGPQLVAGVIALFYEDRVLPYYGGATRDALPLAVNDFMYWELMRRAAALGSRVFDFGRSRVGTGAYHFKRHWGFEPRPLPYQYLLVRACARPKMNPSNPRLRWPIAIWKRLPLALTNRVGPWLTHYLA